MNVRALLSALLFMTGMCVSSAQEQSVSRANKKYNAYSFSPAIDIYKKVLDRGFESADLLGKLGNSYYFNADYVSAAPVYGALIEKYGAESDVVTPDYVFRYAQTLKTLGNLDESNKMMARYASMAKSSSIGAAQVENYLELIERNSGRYDLKNFPYNSPYSDFAPSFYEKGLIFASDRDTGNFARYRHTWNSKDFLDLYTVKMDSASQSVSKLSGDVNTRLHESTSIVTKDGSTMYFTRNNFIGRKSGNDQDGLIRLKIYKAEMVDGEWINIEELPFNSDDYSVAHPMLSPNEKELYFVSDMPGSKGESDIYKVKIVGDGSYGSPVNLGENINTEARETFPFIDADNVLYFASDGHPGLGGLDVFATKIAFDDYTQPVVNVGKPINGKYDDFSYVVDKESKKGFFASNRVEGMGDDDIYGFDEKEPLQLECLQQITGTVRDRLDNKVLTTAKVVVIDEDNKIVGTANVNEEGKYVLECNCAHGNFVRATMEGYVPSEEFVPASDGKPTIIDFYLERDEVTAGFGDDLAKLLQLSTIYFDLNKYNIRPDAEIEVQKVIAAMEKYPSLRIKVNSHTDSRGRDSYNKWLSQKRAESTVDYMVSKGISRDRLIGEGYGEEDLLNNCGNGVPCTEAQHQLNRRSEFIILEEK